MYPTGDATNGDLRASGRSFYSGVGDSCERCERVFTRLGAPRGRNPQLCCKLLKRQQHRWLGQADILGWFGIGLALELTDGILPCVYGLCSRLLWLSPWVYFS